MQACPTGETSPGPCQAVRTAKNSQKAATFRAIVNPPQAAILAVGAIEERAVVREGELVARPVMELTLTCDHRSVDGATASEFLRTVKQFLEEPGLAL